MKRLNIPMILSGLACLPATFYETRRGANLLSIVFICLLVTTAFFINQSMKVQSNRKYLSFILGALVSEILLLVYWGMRYGFDDGYGFSFNFQLLIMEFIAITVIGCSSIAILNLLTKLITRSRT